jgi:hypothetical protein
MGEILLANEIEACSLIYQTDLKQLDAATKFSSSDSSPSPTKEFPSMRKPPAEAANRAKRETVGRYCRKLTRRQKVGWRLKLNRFVDVSSLLIISDADELSTSLTFCLPINN